MRRPSEERARSNIWTGWRVRIVLRALAYEWPTYMRQIVHLALDGLAALEHEEAEGGVRSRLDT
jgi:hypothetical protein